MRFLLNRLLKIHNYIFTTVAQTSPQHKTNFLHFVPLGVSSVAQSAYSRALVSGRILMLTSVGGNGSNSFSVDSRLSYKDINYHKLKNRQKKKTEILLYY